MSPRRKIPAIIGMALSACGLLIIYVHLVIYVHLAWPERFDRLVEPFLPWRVEASVKLAAAALTVGVIVLLVASTASSKDQN